MLNILILIHFFLILFFITAITIAHPKQLILNNEITPMIIKISFTHKLTILVFLIPSFFITPCQNKLNCHSQFLLNTYFTTIFNIMDNDE